MKCTVQLTEAERLTLQQLSLNHKHRDIRTRAAGLLLLARGFNVAEIGAELCVNLRTVYNWNHAWHDFGICGLLVGHAGGRPRALSPEMIATAVEAATAESLTLSGIAQRVEAEHGPLPCTLETLATNLKEQGLSYKRSRFSLKKNETRKSLL